ncbi:MAG: PCMD domain-containing protein, partial [Muribaculaceae bacterium]|nr:PCMD domain-containing protein [Muribaculaceae bacterium]
DTSVQDYGIEYRESGASDWTKVSAKGKNSLRRKVSSGSSRADKVAFSVNLTGLKPSTTYEYRSYCDGYEGSSVLTFSTESPFEIPNASFESWSSYSASTLLGTKSVVLPGGEGNKDLSFWGSGNEGAATANLVLTNKNTDIKHTGSASARLESKTAMGMLAAGNVFVGSYVKTDGTNGVLSLGRSYNGSHPNMLRVWANYRPGTVGSVKDENAEFLPANFKGGQDHGQVYVALTTEPVEIRTNPSNRKLFDPEDPVVLAYGEKTLTSKFGPDGELAALEVPITYNERAKTQRPMYLVIVVSASKYGDYFSGAAGSVFYLDDFELVY